MTEKEMEKKIKSLERRIEKLERSSRQKNGRVERKRKTRARNSETTAARGKLSERERAIEVLRNAGMLAELTPEDKALAAEWRVLPEERKQEVIRKLDSIRFDPPLSETIIRDRG